MKSSQNNLGTSLQPMHWPWYITLPVALLIFHLGTRASLYFTVAPGTALWYWPIPLGLILIQWWGPKVLLPLYLNAVLSAGLWGLPQWQFWPVYALPETGQVFLSWLLFRRFYQGLPWLPDFRNQQRFLIWGIFVPSLIGNLWLQAEFLFLGDITQASIASTFLISWVADLLSNLVVALPALYFLTPMIEKNGFLRTSNDQRVRSRAKLDLFDWLKIALVFGLIWYVSLWLPPQDYWFIYGLIILGVAFEAGLILVFAVNIWVICCVLFFPAFLPVLYSWHWLPTQNLSSIYLSLICLFTAGISVARALEELRANMARLAESESRFRLLAENSTDMISRHDTLGNYLYVSPACRTLLGYEPEELLGHSGYDFMDPADVLVAEQVRSNIIEQPIDFSTIFRIRRKNGEYIWLETIGHTIFDKETGNALEIHAASRDITSRKRTEDALRESEARFRALVENAPEAIVVLDLEKGVFTDCNDNACRLYQLSRDELLTKGIVDLSPPLQPDGSPSPESMFEKLQLAAGGEFPRFEWIHRNVLGDDIPCEINLTRLPSSDGVFIRGSVVNITEHKQIVRMLEQRTYDLGERIKELNCLYRISELVRATERPLVELLQSVVELLPPAWQFPSVTCARLRLDGQIFQTENFQETPWMQNAEIILHGKSIGLLEVGYLEEQPISAEGPFLQEERFLINVVAERTGKIIEYKQAEKELRQAEELFRAVVEDQTEMIVRWKPDGTRTFVNKAYCRTFGKSYEEIVGTSFWPVVAESFRERKLAWIRSLSPESPYSTSIHMSLLPDGNTQWQEWADHGFFDENGQLIELQSVGRDISERRRIEQEERQHAARRDALAEISQALANVGLDAQAVFDVIARYTADHIGDSCTIRLLSSDGQWLNLVAFHHPVEETEELLKPTYFAPMPTTQEWFHQVLKTGKSILLPVITEKQINSLLPSEFRSIAGWIYSGLIVPLRTEGQVIGTIALTRVDPSGAAYTHNDQVLLQELADRAGLTIHNVRLFEQVAGARERLEALSHRLLEVQEAERRALTSELHDRVGQNLTGLSINLQNMKALLSNETAQALATRFDDAQALVQDTTRQIRDIMAELHLPELEDYGLAAALETYAERAASRAHLELIADLPDLPTRLPSDVRIALFRATQEAISNVLKHAKATRLEVGLEQQNGRVRLWVGDNGQGFESGAGSQKTAQTWGLNIMRERIEAIGGDVQIKSKPGQGTRVTFEVGRSQ